MKLFVTILFAVSCSIAAGQETANGVAVTVIQKYFSPSENGARSRLNALMATEAVNEETRICYAVTLIDDKIQLAHRLKSGMAPIPHEAELLKMREMLLKRLQEFSERSQKKASQ